MKTGKFTGGLALVDTKPLDSAGMGCSQTDRRTAASGVWHGAVAQVNVGGIFPGALDAVGGMTARERLAIAGQILAARASQIKPDASPADIAVGRRMLVTLRAKIRGKAAGSLQDIDLFDLDGAERLVADRAAELLDKRGGANPGVRAEAAQLLVVANYLANAARIAKAPLEQRTRIDDLSAQLGMLSTGGDEQAERLALADEMMASETAKSIEPVMAEATVLKQARDSARDLLNAGSKEIRDIEEAALEYVRQGRAAETRAIEDWDYNGGAGRDYPLSDELTNERAALVSAWNEKGSQLRAEIAAEAERKKSAIALRNGEALAVFESAKAALAGVGSKALAKALELSPVSPEAANDWAKAQEISPGAATALKRIGYPVDKVREDMAEFYRLTAGRLSAIKIRTSRGRASAEGIHGHSTSIINMGSRFGKRTLFHEMGHHIEADPAALRAAKGFLARTREDETVWSLRRLVPGSSYRANEKAYKNGWIDPYVGKVYSDATEVFSMGLESFSDPAVLAERMAKDPRHFKLILGYLGMPKGASFDAMKQVLAQRAALEADAKEEQGAHTEAALAELASGVTWGPVPAEQMSRLLRDFWGYERDLESGVAKVIGYYQGILAIDHKQLRDPSTKRRKRGISLLRMEGGRGFTSSHVFGGDLEARAKARAWVAAGSDWPPSLGSLDRLRELVAQVRASAQGSPQP